MSKEIKGARLRKVASILTAAGDEGRATTVDWEGSKVVVTTSPADDLGHRFEIGRNGGVKDTPLGSR